MTHFPVTNSNLSAAHLSLFLQEKYHLSETTKCNIIRAGINDTYLVTDKLNKFVFRVYSLNWRTKIEISEEIKLLNLLRKNNISISYPIADSANNFIQTLNAPEGDRFAVLFSYAHGIKVHNFSAENHFQVGVLMAHLHQVTNGLKLNRVNYTPQLILVDPMIQIAKFLQADTEEMRFMQSTQKFLLEELLSANKKEIRNGIVHLDIWFDNLNITENNEITIFDFDFCGNSWLVMDIAYYILQVYNIERYEKKDYEPKVESFLKGYESVSNISGEEKRLIPIIGVSLYFFYLGIQSQRYDNWSNSFLSEDYLKRYINGLVKRYFNLTISI